MTTDYRTQLASMALGEVEKGDFLLATKILTAGILEQPNNYEHYFDRSICHHKLCNYQASLDDSNTAIRLNPDNFNIHYQKGLALIGLSRLQEAIKSFKKAIELRAKQEESKLSDIFKLLRDASNELNTARHRLGLSNNNQSTNHSNLLEKSGQTVGGEEPVDSTTDRQAGTSSNQSSLGGLQTVAINSNSHTDTSQQQQLQQHNHHIQEQQQHQQQQQQMQRETTTTTSIQSQSSLQNNSTALVTANPPAVATVSKDNDSYSSKYKRLRRDRERARRGTSKLCTIKPSDFEELRIKRSEMRVIAPIDGWLYSGRLSVLDGSPTVQYVVKLDGDATGSNYYFNQDTVTDVIKEVPVETVSELRKGARICCYWNRQIKCLSTGVVTSRTFEATKSLVSVKYDKGDLTALPLEDLRLLPPDYPKYMSVNPPFLLARNGLMAINNNNDSTTKMISNNNSNSNNSNNKNNININNIMPNTNGSSNTMSIDVKSQSNINHEEDEQEQAEEEVEENVDEDEDHDDPMVLMAKEENSANNISTKETTTNNNQMNTSLNTSFGPWVFEGPPKRSKRHGRIYRDIYTAIRRGNEVIRIGDSAELMPRDESILPFIAKIDGFWATCRNEMKVRVRWYYRLVETEGEPHELHDGDNALFETDHFDENDVQSIYRSTKILSWTDYKSIDDKSPKIFYLAGYYDPVRRIKHLRTDVKESLMISRGVDMD